MFEQMREIGNKIVTLQENALRERLKELKLPEPEKLAGRVTRVEVEFETGYCEWWLDRDTFLFAEYVNVVTEGPNGEPGFFVSYKTVIERDVRFKDFFPASNKVILHGREN